METKEIKSITPFNKVLYIVFLVFTAYQVFVKQDYMEAAATAGIALAFDPFDTQQVWQDRPLWQKVWLFVHLALVGLLFGLGLGLGDK